MWSSKPFLRKNLRVLEQIQDIILVLTRNNSTPVRSLVNSGAVSGGVSSYWQSQWMDVDDVTCVTCRLMI